jgi:hypothetical protein
MLNKVLELSYTNFISSLAIIRYSYLLVRYHASSQPW